MHIYVAPPLFQRTFFFTIIAIVSYHIIGKIWYIKSNIHFQNKIKQKKVTCFNLNCFIFSTKIKGTEKKV